MSCLRFLTMIVRKRNINYNVIKVKVLQNEPAKTSIIGIYKMLYKQRLIRMMQVRPLLQELKLYFHGRIKYGYGNGMYFCFTSSCIEPPADLNFYFVENYAEGTTQFYEVYPIGNSLYSH